MPQGCLWQAFRRLWFIPVAVLPIPVLGGQPAIPSPAVVQGISPDLSLPPVRWAEMAAANEEHIINFDTGTPLRYRVRRIDAKGEVLREIVESKEGSVARTVGRNGQSLTAEEDAAERERLQGILKSPEGFLRRARRDEGSKTYATELLHSMPKAMLWSYAPGQRQLPGAPGVAVVLDFQPDPAFHPPSLLTEGLTGIAGRVWIDGASHCLTRIEGRTLRPVDFGWGGFLARIKEGGTVELEQSRASDRRWLYSHLVEHLSIREILVHTVEENAELTATNVEALRRPLSYREAIDLLLALPVPTR